MDVVSALAAEVAAQHGQEQETGSPPPPPRVRCSWGCCSCWRHQRILTAPGGAAADSTAVYWSLPPCNRKLSHRYKSSVLHGSPNRLECREIERCVRRATSSMQRCKNTCGGFSSLLEKNAVRTYRQRTLRSPMTNLRKATVSRRRGYRHEHCAASKETEGCRQEQGKDMDFRRLLEVSK